MEAILTKTAAVFSPPRADSRQAPPPDAGSPVQVGDGPLMVLQTTAEQMFLDIPADKVSALPKCNGDLELTEHSAGSLTSQAYMKRWNRKNELLADAAKRASVAAEWLGGIAYPQQRLNDAWTLVLGGQFHDILPGTSIPKAYEYSWNDEVLALNQFAGVLTSATEAVASGMKTQSKGTPVAWFASHRHTADGKNEAYAYSYLFAYELDLPENAKTLTLPNNEKIRVPAVTVSDDGAQVYPAQPLYDTLDKTAKKQKIGANIRLEQLGLPEQRSRSGHVLGAFVLHPAPARLGIKAQIR